MPRPFFSSAYTAIVSLSQLPVPQVLLLLSTLGFALSSVTVEAATTDTNASPTPRVQLIDLNSSDALEGYSGDELRTAANDLDNLMQSDDAIDGVVDESAVDENNNDTQMTIPTEVAKVSLNAISPETLKNFVAVIDLVRREYIYPVNDEELFDNAMSGVLIKLDSHAEFLDAEAYDNLRAFTQGDVGDIGLEVTYQPSVGYWVVVDVIDNSPADKKGISVGDYLHQIDDFKLDEEKASNDIKQRLTGIAGTQVDIVTSKAGRRKRTVSLQRNNNHPQLIETHLVDGIAVIKLPAFQDNSREKLLDSLIVLEAPVSGILLDVRDNPGGVLTSAVKVASLFMSNTDVVKIKGREGESKTLSTEGSAPLEPLPVVILQNRYSASAAEVLASSLQAQNRATIVGEVSYGKGSVQSVIPLNDEQAIKLTVAHYLTAAGKKIDGIGVNPDTALIGNQSSWEQQALKILRQKINSPGIRFVKQSTSTGDDSAKKPTLTN